jgi:CheY-like chemotaxis protein
MSDQSRLDGVRVLVVDDTRSVLDVVTDMLECNGAAVTAVDSAEEALDVLQREHPDVLLSDLSMPGKGGYWLIGQVRALSPELARHLRISESGTASILRVLMMDQPWGSSVVH